jgi:hypothetical protein
MKNNDIITWALDPENRGLIVIDDKTYTTQEAVAEWAEYVAGKPGELGRELMLHLSSMYGLTITNSSLLSS